MREINKYVFKKYRKSYPLFFQKEKKRLKKIFPRAEIEHVGSTSIPGLGGKNYRYCSLGF